MAGLGLRFVFEFRNNALRQRLAKLNAPLVERIYLPNRTLSEHAVFVQRDERAERLGCEPFGQDRVRRAVAIEDTMRHKPIRRTLGLDLLGRLAEGQRLGL